MPNLYIFKRGLIMNTANIIKIIKTLQRIIKFNVSFITLSHEFIGNQPAFNHLKRLVVKGQHPHYFFVFYPLVIDNSITGTFVLLATHPVSSTDAKIIRVSLESGFKAIDSQNAVNVLDPLAGQALIDYLLLLKNSSIFMNKAQFPIDQGNEQTSIINTENALNYIKANLTSDLRLETVANAVYLSPTYLSKLFKENLNLNFIDYVNMAKITTAEEKLIFSKDPIVKVATTLGFTQASYFTKLFRKWTGVTPSEYRRTNKNVKYMYTILRSANWHDNLTVSNVSQQYFHAHNIKFKELKNSADEYMYAINDLTDKQNRNAGWLYLVDCSQPMLPSNRIYVADKNIIQWIYVEDNR